MQYGTFPVFSPEGAPRGSLTASPDGLFSLVTYEWPDLREVSRLWGLTPAGPVSLGIPVPGAPALRRRLSRLEAAETGLDGLTGGLLAPLAWAPAREETAQAPDPAPLPPPADAPAPGPAEAPVRHAGWAREDHPESLLRDPLLRASARGLSGALASRASDGSVLLALPLRGGRDWPLVPVFRLGSIARITGRDYVLYRIVNGSVV